jgi:hypothetical protein
MPMWEATRRRRVIRRDNDLLVRVIQTPMIVAVLKDHPLKVLLKLHLSSVVVVLRR